MKCIARSAICVAWLLGAAGLVVSLLPAAADEMTKRGEYLAHIMDCTGCHTPGALAGKPDMSRYLAGSKIGFHLPGLGIFWPRNLTPDKATGMGDWSADDIIRAVTKGERPDGRMLAPIMPWHEYSHLTGEDARALAAYLKNLPPVRHKVPDIVGGPEDARAPYLTVVVPE